MKKTVTALVGALVALHGSHSWAQSSQPVPVVDRNAVPSVAVSPTASSNAGGVVGGSSVGAVVPRAAAQQSATAELLMLLDQLQQEVQSLRNQVEVQGHQLKKMRTNQRDRYRDLDRRISNLTRQAAQTPAAPSSMSKAIDSSTPVQASKPKASSPVAAVKAVSPAPRISDREAYQQAFALVRKRSYVKSLSAFGDFIRVYPGSSLVPNAMFWTGEVHRAQTEFDSAKTAYQQLIEQFPNHQKTADAHYKLGVTYDLMGDYTQAQSAMKKVISLYPDHSSATLAKDYLKKNLNKK